MRKSQQLCSKLAVERCRLYTAQLCAAHYLMDRDEYGAISSLITGLNRDLDVLERCIDSNE